MKKPSRLDYAYAVGRIRVLEKKLVERAVFSEASEENDFSSAMKVVFDAGDFPEEMVELKDSDELDEFLEKEEEALQGLMDAILLDSNVFDIYLEESNPQEAMSIAESMDYAFIKDYLRHKIDLSNLKIFCRIKYSGHSIQKFENLILKGGFLDEKILLQNFDLTYGEIGDKLRASAYQDLWNRAIDVLEERETFVEFERGIEDFLMKYLRKAKYIVFGPEPVFAYGLAKRKELRAVRLLGVGKLNHVPSELLKERISETYV
ncbi:MAG: V-type ATPase subunit [Candidatus Aminicenantes bacterium]|nr:MAG: V-type ATPase subunit [Candidatus Aminicenantes bacterium]